MKNDNVHTQALHRKLDVVLVQILPYNCSETDYSFCEDSPPSRTSPSTRMWVSPSDPFSPPPLFFRSAAPDKSKETASQPQLHLRSRDSRLTFGLRRAKMLGVIVRAISFQDFQLMWS